VERTSSWGSQRLPFFAVSWSKIKCMRGCVVALLSGRSAIFLSRAINTVTPIYGNLYSNFKGCECVQMKFGLIVPSSNVVMEAEYWKMAWGWATIHTARMRLEDITVKALEEMEKHLLDAANRLADAGVDIIGYGCTSGSLFKGRDHPGEIEQNIENETGIPAVATSNAVIEVLDALEIEKICVATPYIEEINGLERKFLEQNGKEVLRIKGLGIVRNREVGNKEPSAAYELAKEVIVPETQGIFISCTNFRTLEVINRLEEELKVPVISSNTATFWAMMKKAGVKKRLEGYGKIFSEMT